MRFKFVAVLFLVSLAAWPGNVPAASDANAASGAQTRKAKKSKKKKTPPKPSSSRTSRAAVGSQPVTPGTLKAMAKGVLENNSIIEQHNLELFAQTHRGDGNGVLANLVLGYHAYQEKHNSEATKFFEAARALPSPIRDYAEYYLALSKMAEGDNAGALALLEGFAARYPSSPFAIQATLDQADCLMTLSRPAEAIALLQSPPVPLPGTSMNFLLGEAYEKLEQPEKAAPYFQWIYYFNPTAWQAAPTEKHLRDLKLELGAAYPEPSEEMHKARAESLFAAAQWKEAESEYRMLAKDSSRAARDHARVRIAVCMSRVGDVRGALATLKSTEVSDPDSEAERLYMLASLYRRMDEAPSMEEQIRLLGQFNPDSAWYEKALFLAGTYYWPSLDPERAVQFHTMVFERFPESEDAVESHWRVAWQKYLERRVSEARKLFEEHVRRYPSSSHVSSAIYWLARTLEKDSPATAALYYTKLVQTFPNYYYGLLASERLAALPKLPAQDGKTETLPVSLLDPIRRPVADPALDGNIPPAQQEHRNRAGLLESAWLIDLAIGELKAAIGDTQSFDLGWDLAHLEVERGRYNVALRYAKRLFSGYFALNVPELPREDWELLFPLPWWEQIKQKSQLLELDPYLVAGLIRQESEFNPEARSRSDARGLMQLLPSTARGIARQVSGSRVRFNVSSLNSPELNVAYGTRYLRQMLDQFNGGVEQALAAYNAGEHRVLEWLQGANFQEPAEFVESIPFTETHEYVQAVLRNAALYRKLYGDGK